MNIKKSSLFIGSDKKPNLLLLTKALVKQKNEEIQFKNLAITTKLPSDENLKSTQKIKLNINCDKFHKFSEYRYYNNIDQLLVNQRYLVGREGGREAVQSQQRDSGAQNNIERMQTQYNQEEVQLLNQDKQNDTLRYNFFYDVGKNLEGIVQWSQGGFTWVFKGFSWFLGFSLVFISFMGF